MKSLIIIAVSAITFASCNSSDNKSADNKSTQPTSAEVDKKKADVTEK